MSHPPVESNVGILLTNLGTPDAPTPRAVRKYLKEFLWDPRVVEIPRPIWFLILYGFILPFRPYRSANWYKKIWTEAGSPLRVILENQADQLREKLGDQVPIVTAMRYGQPSIEEGLKKLSALKVKKILLFPLYPQYSATTTASTLDEVARVLKSYRWQPALRTINGYHDEPDYIAALVKSVQQDWQQHGKSEKLLFSFHGLPKSFLEKGDPYYCFCQKTARLVAEQLHLAKEDYATSFQSRLGRAEWLQPYTDQLLMTWAKQGIKNIQVICPGFSADCLETLEEIQQLNRETFLSSGGEVFRYIPALNDTPAHIDALYKMIERNLQGF